MEKRRPAAKLNHEAFNVSVTLPKGETPHVISVS
jgi:hypothetical protein